MVSGGAVVVAAVSLTQCGQDENLDVPGKVGSLVLNMQGKLLKSDGELEAEAEKHAALFFNMLQDASAVLGAVGSKDDPFKRLSINCGSFVYVVTVANETIYVVKKDA